MALTHVGLQHDLGPSQLRRMAAVGPAGVVLELDKLPGVVLARFYSRGDHGEPGVIVPPGEEVIEVVTTGDARDVFDHVHQRFHGAEVLAVVMVRPPTWRDRWEARRRWRQWQKNTQRVRKKVLDALDDT